MLRLCCSRRLSFPRLSGPLLFVLLLASTVPTAHSRFNVLMLAVDDLRGHFGAAFGNPEVQTPNTGLRILG